MAKQSASLIFESSLFPIEPGEDKHTNPQVYGKALAHWLSEQLQAHAIQTQEIIPEDFGWCIPIASTPRLYVACANIDKTENHWQIFVFLEQGFLSRLFAKGHHEPTVNAVHDQIKQILLATPSIWGVRSEQ